MVLVFDQRHVSKLKFNNGYKTGTHIGANLL